MPKRVFKPIYVHDGFTLRTVQILASGDELLHCTQRKTSVKCNALGRRAVDGFISISKPHSGHSADDEVAIAKIARIKIKERAQSSAAAPKNILKEVRRKYGARPVMIAGSTSTLGRLISRQRNKKQCDTAADVNAFVFQENNNELKINQILNLLENIEEASRSPERC
ncbi:hypothetical protein L5515_019009 [Caenorhabditis briggsae]|uniref:Uncharacterized protein n=1 Tax=Caenorhabditis briggsae TaxID=6238 RepID=A0AAE9FL07_CAEBR|nr:hypothetical protein L5515_019009 [Caenorhabditis briggsae]